MLDSRSTHPPTKENTKKQKNPYFCKKPQFFRSKAFHRASLHCKTNVTDLHQQKRCKFKIFANPDPSERHLRFEPLAPSALALAVHQKLSLSDVSSRNGNPTNRNTPFHPLSLCWSMAFHPSAAL